MTSGRRRLVLLTSSFPRWAGDNTTPFVQQFAQRIARAYGAVHVIAPHFQGAAHAEEPADNLSVRRFRYAVPYRLEDIAYGGNAVARVRFTPLYAVKLALFLLSSLASVLAARARLINVHWLVPQGLVAMAAKRLTGAKVVVTVHGGDVFSLNNRLFVMIKKFILKGADVVVTNSAITRQACEQLYPHRSYEVIPMGVDTEKFHPAPKSVTLVERYGLGDFTILFVGRLTEDKGLIYLIQALGQLKDSGADFKALIVGSGDQESQLKALTTELGLDAHVVFIGWVPSEELPDYYNTADVFVGPSVVGSKGWQEALGLVFIEALATGLPVISTNTGGIADVVEDGVTGYLVDQRSSEQIARRLQALYEDRAPLQELSRHGRATVERRFSWDTVTSAYARVFVELSK